MKKLALIRSGRVYQVLRFSVMYRSKNHDYCQRLNDIFTKPSPIIFALNRNNSYESLLVPVFLMKYRKSEKISFAIDWMFENYRSWLAAPADRPNI